MTNAPVIFRPGRIKNDPSKPRLKAGAFLSGDAPVSADFYTGVAQWGMLGNDEWGDCTCAGDGHIICQQTALGDGIETAVSTAQALQAYEVVGHFNPNAGPPGQNPTDNGAQVQDALSYLRKTGIANFKIAAFAELNVSDTKQVKLACSQFGCLSIGINLPRSAMTQFNAGQPWTVVPGAQIDGGHCVIVVGYDAEWVYVVTWGQVQKMSWLFWAKYVEEAWVIISKDWAGKLDPAKVDLYTMGQEFAALTGEANPFPAPSPNPPPVPVPTPVPTPVPPRPPVPGGGGFWGHFWAELLGFFGL